MSQRFEVPGRLMGRNEHDYLNRSHWSKGREAKQKEQEKVEWAIRMAGIKPAEGPVEIGVNYIEGKSRNGKIRDVDNIAGGGDKVILDALKTCGIIPDDNPKHVRNVYHRFAFNAKNPHVEVEIMDYSPDGRTVYYPPISGID